MNPINSMNTGNPLTVSLEEFGLSRYEARAYFAMISRRPLSAGEIAYYAEIPRTKVYSTLEKLRKKKLAIGSSSKPMTWTAVAPEDAFDPIIQEQINKVNSMNTLISSLKKINGESRKNRGIKERRYQHLTPGSALQEMAAMIERSHTSADMMITSPDTTHYCRKQIVASIRRGVTVRLITTVPSIGSDCGDIVPGGVQARMTEHSQNYAVIDGSSILVMDDAGGGDLVPSSESLGRSLATFFNTEWERAIPAEPLLDLTGHEISEIYRSVRIFEADRIAALDDTYQTPDMAALLESNGVEVHSKTINDLVDMAGYALKVSVGGSGRLDAAGGAISLESNGRRGHVQAWATVLDSYLQRRGYTTRRSARNGHVRIWLKKL